MLSIFIIWASHEAQRADERRRSAQHGGVRSIGWLGEFLTKGF
jgi:hypothetical protein